MFLIFAGFSSAQFHSYLFESKGLLAIEVGLALSAGYAAGILSPAAQVHFIRWLHGPRRPLLFMLGISAICLALLPHLSGFWPIAVAFSLGTFCLSSVHPLNVGCTLEIIRHRGHGLFFQLRSLGTAGFLLGCIGSAFFQDLGDLPLLYLGFGGALLAALLIVRRSYPQAGAPAGTDEGRARPPGMAEALKLLGRPETLRLLLLLGIVNLANSMATGVQGNYLVNHWESGQRSISVAWIVSTAFEIPWMFLCMYILRRTHLRYVLLVGVLGTAGKLAGMGLAQSLWQFYLSLSLHGFFFAGAATGFNVYLDRVYAPSESPTLQTLSVIFYAGLPMALGGLFAGALWQWASLPAVYWAAGALALLAALVGLPLLLRLETPSWAAYAPGGIAVPGAGGEKPVAKQAQEI